jgi:rhamnopyranosyl-N-acetylglucosaminyl-diphospho-decaprenol beta-1,3/1,4-galactofuranosyltransferase
MALSVASITISYNGKSLLARHINSLLAQKRPIDEIVVVDNGSSDGTSEFLAEHFPQVRVVRLDVNAGTAGGWAAGMRYAAVERRHDWLWTFDDDSEPAEDALERMMAGAARVAEHERVGIVAPVPVHPETGRKYYPLLLQRGRAVAAPAEVIHKTIWFADMVIASGCMVRREVVEEIGLPLAGFYMDFFDFEYCLRAREAGYRIAVISECEMKHEIGNMKTTSIFGWKRASSIQPPWRHYYIARNLMYTAWHLPGRKITRFGSARTLLRGVLVTLLLSDQKASVFLKQVQGAWDGVRGRLGIRFMPRAYSR